MDNGSEELSPLEDIPHLEDIPLLEHVTPTSSSARPSRRRRVQVPGDESDNSMPDLQSVSNSSNSEYASDDSESESGNENENENDEAMEAVDDDNDLAWTDDDQDSQMPPLEPLEPLTTRSNRRARVQDDHDGERDRRHPSQRGANVCFLIILNYYYLIPLFIVWWYSYSHTHTYCADCSSQRSERWCTSVNGH